MATKIKKKPQSKRKLREQLSLQLHLLLTSFKDMLNEKKLHKLVKKAAHLLADGLHQDKSDTPTVNKKTAAKRVPPKKTVKKKSKHTS